MSLLEVRHQPHAQEMIQRALIRDRLPHATIFHGPDGVGKEMLARALVQRLLCENPQEAAIDPESPDFAGLSSLSVACGRCDQCRLIQASTHPDLHLIHRQLIREHPDPEIRKRKGLDIGVDVVRQFIIDRAGMTPARGRIKAFVVREADRITTAAQNALLKTLEEPPADTVIILLVSALDQLLPTTRSRCRTVRFDVLPRPFIIEKLAELAPDVDAEQQAWYAACADGSLGAALVSIEENLYEINERLIEGLSSFSAGGEAFTAQSLTEESKSLGELYRKRDPDITDTEAGRRAIKSLLRLMAGWYGDVLRFAVRGEEGVVNTRFASNVASAADRLTPERAAEAVNRLATAEHQLDLNVNTQLCLDSLLIDLARIQAK